MDDYKYMKQAKKKTPAVKEYVVIEKFHGHINEKRFDHKKDEVIELTPAEYDIYKRFVKEKV